VRLLFDQNLSRRLVQLLADVYPDSLHVVDAELSAADDRAVWDLAKERGLTTVSKDSDFRQLS
jgi:predicted nuclease of predicted toxin-antitoxin system